MTFDRDDLDSVGLSLLSVDHLQDVVPRLQGVVQQLRDPKASTPDILQCDALIMLGEVRACLRFLTVEVDLLESVLSPAKAA